MSYQIRALSETQKLRTVLYQPIITIVLAFVLALGLTAFYTMPLFKEIKYIYYGRNESDLKPNQFLPLSNLLNTKWDYFRHVATRGYTISTGIPELIIIVLSVMVIIYTIYRCRTESTKKYILNQFTNLNLRLSIVSIISFLTLLFFTHQESKPFYEHIKLLAGIQYPWRMYSSIIFIPPILLAYLHSKMPKYQISTAIAIILIIAVLRFPLLYTKNNILYPQDHYYYPLENWHGVIMSTIWMGLSEQYPVHPEKIGIIEGQATVLKSKLKNSKREYQVEAKTDIRLADYTFYFPGWKVFVDKQEVPIQFQDPDYRGVITYKVPKGIHDIKLVFTNTKIRIVGYIVSLSSIIFIILSYLIYYRYSIRDQTLA